MLVEKTSDYDLGEIDTEKKRVRELRKSDSAVGIGDEVECFWEWGEPIHSTLKFCEDAFRKLWTLGGIPSDDLVNLGQACVNEARVHFVYLIRRAAMASSASTEPISPFL